MDLFSIGRSKTRKAILQLYFSYPEKKYYLRELERKLGFPVHNIRRELINLEKTGIFKKEKLGKQVYYYLNIKSPIYKDISNKITKTIGIEAQLKESLIETVILMLAGGLSCLKIYNWTAVRSVTEGLNP